MTEVHDVQINGLKQTAPEEKSEPVFDPEKERQTLVTEKWRDFKLDQAMQEAERQFIARAIGAAGSVAFAARLLKVQRTTLDMRMKKLGMNWRNFVANGGGDKKEKKHGT